MESLHGLASKKILFVITKSNWGGAQAYVYQLATYCAEHGAQVAVALGGSGLPGAAPGLLAERLAAANIQTIALPSFSRDVSLTREFRAFGEMYDAIRGFGADVVHVNSSKAGGLGTLAARLAGVKHIIFTAHGWPHREPRPLLARVLIWLASWVTIAFSTDTIVLSNLDYSGAPVFFSRKKLALIRNGVAEFSLLKKETAREYLATKVSTTVPTSGHWILMQAELHKNKGVDISISAFAKIAGDHPDAILVVMGEGEERNRLETLIKQHGLEERVFLLGFVANSREYLRAGSVFLMTSYKEGMPLALLEAAQAELPIVSTAVGAIPEMIENNVTGLLVPSGNIDAVATALSSLLSDETHAHELGEVFSAHVKKEFSAEQMLDITAALYS